VNLTLVLGALWTIPVGVAIGFNPRLARIAQPLAQIAASVPATAVFPVVMLVLIRMAEVWLWIDRSAAARHAVVHSVQRNRRAMAIPTDLKEAASVFGIRGWSAGAS